MNKKVLSIILEIRSCLNTIESHAIHGHVLSVDFWFRSLNDKMNTLKQLVKHDYDKNISYLLSQNETDLSQNETFPQKKKQKK